MEDKQAQSILATFEEVKSARGRWESVWRDVGTFVAPSRHIEHDGFVNIPVRRNLLYDNTAPDSALQLASIMYGILTNPASQWFGLKPDTEDREALLWSRQVELICMRLLASPKTGFNSAMAETFIDHATFGTSTMSLLEDTDAVVRFRAHPLGEIFPAQNEAGVVDTVFRRFMYTADQAAGIFGIENLSDGARTDLISKERYTKQRQYVHAVIPRTDRDATLPNSANMPFASAYIDVEAKQRVSEGGFRQFPYLVSRFSKVSGEVYGESPAIRIIEEIKMANTMRRTGIIAKELATLPPRVAPDNSVIGQLQTTPNGMTYVREGAEITTLPTGDPRIGDEAIAESRSFIQQGFLLDKLNLPLQDRMTATEVIERRRDALQVMAPFVARMQEEHLAPMFTRLLGILSRRGMLPPLPDSVGGMEVEYISPLAVSQRAGEMQSVQTWLGLMTPIGQIDPTALETINTEELSRGAAISLNVPPQYVRDPEEVAQRRRQAEQQQALAQAAQTGGELADAVKTVSEIGATTV